MSTIGRWSPPLSPPKTTIDPAEESDYTKEINTAKIITFKIFYFYI